MNKWITTASDSFCAAHRLHGYIGDCAFLHGHNYRVIVTCSRSVLNDDGISVDFKAIKEVLRRLVKLYDHCVLLHKEDPLADTLVDANQRVVILPDNPTAENLAAMFFNALEVREIPVHSVSVEETDGCVAMYMRGPLE